MTRIAMGAVAALFVVGSGVAWWALQEEETTPAAQHDSDGLSEDEEREMLQEIGYLK